MLDIDHTTQFKRDLKLAKKRQKDISLLKEIIDLILYEKPIPPKHKNHSLSGNWKHHEECHITPDWLLIYKIDKPKNLAVFVRTGSHADLFD